MYYVYILYSENSGQFYTGLSQNVESHLLHHNQGKNKNTQSGLPWKLMYTESFVNEREAMQRERQIKDMKSRSYIMELISSFDL